MIRSILRSAAAALILLVMGCDHWHRADHVRQPAAYVWQVPGGFPIPVVPADNPMTREKVELGRYLFYDTRLSGDGSVSCASCHQPDMAFTDGRDRAMGMDGNLHPRSAMSLTNVAYNSTLGWDDPALGRLETQMLIPLFNTRPPEMGAFGRTKEILARLKGDRRMRKLFHKAFPQQARPVTMYNVIYAIASFERTLISGDSPYDRWAYGADPKALDGEQRAGARLFFSSRFGCFRCHAGFNLSGPVRYVSDPLPEARFHNTALYNEDGEGAYPEPNTGVYRHTGRKEDMGKFRAPTLRNIALTAPYMHDGSIATLEAVLDHYAAGGRTGDRAESPGRASNRDPILTGFSMTAEEKRHLVAFLHALTDRIFIGRALEQAVTDPFDQ